MKPATVPISLDDIIARGDIVAFREYVAICPYRELTILLGRARRIPAFEDAVWKAMRERDR